MSTPAQRRERRRRTLPGFPWNGSFKNPEDAREYAKGDRIQCLFCGQFKKSIIGHI